MEAHTVDRSGWLNDCKRRGGRRLSWTETDVEVKQLGSAPVGRAAAVVTLRVVRCRTRFGVTPGESHMAHKVTIYNVPRSTGRLVAYTNTANYLIGPPHLQCAGEVGSDGYSLLVLWPHGQHEPQQHSAGSGISLRVIPACVGCKAQLTCPYFALYRHDAHKIGLPCPSKPHAGETVRHLSDDLIAFSDPPFVAGAGYPSGRGTPALGLVGLQPGLYGAAFTAS
jgi:hypothetical protein